jgi:hypothetical protein
MLLSSRVGTGSGEAGGRMLGRLSETEIWGTAEAGGRTMSRGPATRSGSSTTTPRTLRTSTFRGLFSLTMGRS